MKISCNSLKVIVGEMLRAQSYLGNAGGEKCELGFLWIFKGRTNHGLRWVIASVIMMLFNYDGTFDTVIWVP